MNKKLWIGIVLSILFAVSFYFVLDFFTTADTETLIIVGNHLITISKIFIPLLIGSASIVYCYGTYKNPEVR